MFITRRSTDLAQGFVVRLASSMISPPSNLAEVAHEALDTDHASRVYMAVFRFVLKPSYIRWKAVSIGDGWQHGHAGHVICV